MINKIKNFFRPKVVLSKIDNDTIKKSLPKINYKVLNPAQHYIVDNKYKSTNLKDFKRLLLSDFTEFKLYIPDYYDCDNFAFKLRDNIKKRFPSFAIGIVFSSGHAFNVFVDCLGNAWFIEPQSDKVFSYKQLTKKYKPINLIIM